MKFFILSITLALIFTFTLAPVPVSAQVAPPGSSVEVIPRGSGWDVKVTWRVTQVNIPSIAYKPGNKPSVTGNYPQPYVASYRFFVDNARCGGNFNPITGQYQFPNRGTSLIWIVIPPNTYANGYFGDCTDDGGITIIPDPYIDETALPVLSREIWERIELPELEIDQNPGVGIVTVPAWFWLKLTATKEWWKGTEPAQGGQPFGVTVTIALPNITHSVQVLADADWLLWDFGDKSVGRRFNQTNLVGKEYPLKSNVTHWYNGADTYEPNVTIHYVPRYAWNGGGFTRLPNEFRESLWEGQYRVREAQTMLIAPRELNPDEK
jgi:hypothetical protein